MTRRRRRRSKKLLDDVKKPRECWKLRDEALDGSVWRTWFVRADGPVVRQAQDK